MDEATTKTVTEQLKRAAARVAHLKAPRGKTLALVESILVSK